MFLKIRCNITAVLIAGLLGISMVTGLTACGGADGTKVVFTTGSRWKSSVSEMNPALRQRS